MPKTTIYLVTHIQELQTNYTTTHSHTWHIIHLTHIQYYLIGKEIEYYLKTCSPPNTGTTHLSRRAYRNGFTSYPTPLRSLRTGWLYRTSGFTWRLCLSEEISPNNFQLLVKWFIVYCVGYLWFIIKTIIF